MIRTAQSTGIGIGLHKLCISGIIKGTKIEIQFIQYTFNHDPPVVDLNHFISAYPAHSHTTPSLRTQV